MENMDFLPPRAANLVFEHETYMAYSFTSNIPGKPIVVYCFAISRN